MEKSLSDRAGKRGFLEASLAWTGSQKQEWVEGTEQEARPEEMWGSKREASPGDTETRRTAGSQKAGSTESLTIHLQESWVLSSSMRPATCSVLTQRVMEEGFLLSQTMLQQTFSHLPSYARVAVF